jgi:hypothetical protein
MPEKHQRGQNPVCRFAPINTGMHTRIKPRTNESVTNKPRLLHIQLHRVCCSIATAIPDQTSVCIRPHTPYDQSGKHH